MTPIGKPDITDPRSLLAPLPARDFGGLLLKKERYMTNHGVRFKPEQMVCLLLQIEALTANDKTLDKPCKSLSITSQSYYPWRKMEGRSSQEV